MNDKDFGIICDVGGKGIGNQDSAFFLESELIIAPGSPDYTQFSCPTILALVCDGVSASQRGEKGSSFVVRNLSSKILNHLITKDFKPSEILDKLKEFIIETNNALVNQFKELIESGKVPKTTLVGVLVIGQWLWVFNLGDSRAYLIKDNQIGQISLDHVGGASHEITEAMGQLKINPEIRVYNWAFLENKSINLSFEKDYYFLICSDGLTDLVKPEEINQMLMNDTEKMQDKVEKLYDLSMERKIDDNVSIIAVNLAKYISNISKVQIMKLSFED
jgi:PPM family protein phosphatase